MTQIKHTPGPWYVDKKTDSSGNFLVASSNVGFYGNIARCERGDHDERKANARLIAAAPKLLKRVEHDCDLLSEFMESLLMTAQDLRGGDEKLKSLAIARLEALYDQARDNMIECAAITAKARGQA